MKRGLKAGLHPQQKNLLRGNKKKKRVPRGTPWLRSKTDWLILRGLAIVPNCAEKIQLFPDEKGGTAEKAGERVGEGGAILGTGSRNLFAYERGDKGDLSRRRS